jgi:hypothetical protein
MEANRPSAIETAHWDRRVVKLPHEYPYNARPSLIFLVSGVGLLWIGVQRLSWGRMPTGFSLWFGLLPIMLALLVGVRLSCVGSSPAARYR